MADELVGDVPILGCYESHSLQKSWGVENE